MNKKVQEGMSKLAAKFAEKAEHIAQGSKWCWTYQPDISVMEQKAKGITAINS